MFGKIEKYRFKNGWTPMYLSLCEGRPPPRLICRLPDSCLATGRHHGSEARCHHHISFIIIVIRMRLSIFLMKKKREAFHIFDWQNLQQVFSAAIHTEYKTDFKFDVFVVKIFDC